MVSPERVCELLNPHGKLQSQNAKNWSGEFPLPEPILEFYRDVGPVNISIPGQLNPTVMPRLADLWYHQIFYRYNEYSLEENDDWDHSDWIVVADDGVDPYIYSIRSSTILLCRDALLWGPTEHYPDLHSMAAGIAFLGSIVKEAGETLNDENLFVRTEYQRQAISGLAEFVGDEANAEKIVKDLGWVRTK